MITIDKHVPIPMKHWPTPDDDPWGRMDVGDSFLADTDSPLAAIREKASWLMGGRVYLALPVEGGVRVWRVA